MLISILPQIMPYFRKHCPELYPMLLRNSSSLTQACRVWPPVLWIGSFKNTYGFHTGLSTSRWVTARATFHFDFNNVQERNPSPSLWWSNRGCPSTAKKWAYPLNWCFPVKLCLGPVLSGVIMCHHPKPSIPCHSEQFLYRAQHQNAHTRILTCEVCSFSLLPHHLSQASPNCIRSFPSHIGSPSPRNVPGKRWRQARHVAGTVTMRAHTTAALYSGAEGGEAAGSRCSHHLWPMPMALTTLQASEGPRRLHCSSATTNYQRLSVQAGGLEDFDFLLWNLN